MPFFASMRKNNAKESGAAGHYPTLRVSTAGKDDMRIRSPQLGHLTAREP
jgi:hypothetical protein